MTRFAVTFFYKSTYASIPRWPCRTGAAALSRTSCRPLGNHGRTRSRERELRQTIKHYREKRLNQIQHRDELTLCFFQ